MVIWGREFKSQGLRKGEGARGTKQGGQVRTEGGISAKLGVGGWGWGRCLGDSLLPSPQLGSQPAVAGSPHPGSIPANSLGPCSGVQDLGERLLEKPGPFPSHQSFSSPPELRED